MKTIQNLIDLFDVPSGSLMGLYTLLMIVGSVYLTLHGKEFPATVVDTYKFVVMSFAGSKAVKTIWGKAIPDDSKPQGQ